MIHEAARIFRLSSDEEERLANKAGLSMKADAAFHADLIVLIKNKSHYKNIYERAQISERMFQYIKNGRIPTKESLIALAVSLGLKLEETEILLSKAGYALSDSIAWDIIVKTLLKQPGIMDDDCNTVSNINNILYDLDLPLLMTREKNISDN